MSEKHDCDNGCKIVSIPVAATIEEIKDEIVDVKTFYLNIDDAEVAGKFKIKSGQFIMCTVFGAGEFAVSLPPSPENDRFHISVRQVGKVTRALHQLQVGDKVGIRGPFGNGFPFEEIKGKNIIYVAGGIGLIPLRSSIVHVLQNRKDFGRIILIYGARSPKDLMYQYNIEEWQKIDGFENYITIDSAAPGWKGETGFVHNMIPKAKVPVENTVAFVCGPPVMFNSVINVLMEQGLPDDCIISTLERHMKCGIGKCQHCAIGRTLVCTDGPVYTYRQIKTLGEQIMDIFREIRKVMAEGAVIVGVGNDMRSDDAAGCHVAASLRSGFPGAKVVNAEDIIESYAFTIAGMDCPNVLLVDAVEAPHAEGSLVFGRFADLKASSVNFSTHKLSLALAVDIIGQSGKTVYLLGIVPGTTDFGFEMGPAVKKSADIIIGLLSECLNHNQKEYVYER